VEINSLIHFYVACLIFWLFGRQTSGSPRNLPPLSSLPQGWPHESKILVGFVLVMKDWGGNNERRLELIFKCTSKRKIGKLLKEIGIKWEINKMEENK